jgi:hypothetical protein
MHINSVLPVVCGSMTCSPRCLIKKRALSILIKETCACAASFGIKQLRVYSLYKSQKISSLKQIIKYIRRTKYNEYLMF